MTKIEHIEGFIKYTEYRIKVGKGSRFSPGCSHDELCLEGLKLLLAAEQKFEKLVQEIRDERKDETNV